MRNVTWILVPKCPINVTAGGGRVRGCRRKERGWSTYSRPRTSAILFLSFLYFSPSLWFPLYHFLFLLDLFLLICILPHHPHWLITGCTQRPRVSGHTSHNWKWPHSRFLRLFLVHKFKMIYYQLLLGGHFLDFLRTFSRLFDDFLMIFWGLYNYFLRTFLGTSEDFLKTLGTFWGLYEDFLGSF